MGVPGAGVQVRSPRSKPNSPVLFHCHTPMSRGSASRSIMLLAEGQARCATAPSAVASVAQLPFVGSDPVSSRESIPYSCGRTNAPISWPQLCSGSRSSRRHASWPGQARPFPWHLGRLLLFFLVGHFLGSVFLPGQGEKLPALARVRCSFPCKHLPHQRPQPVYLLMLLEGWLWVLGRRDPNNL